MKLKNLKQKISFAFIVSMLITITAAFKTFSGQPHSLEDISEHYKTLALLSGESNSVRENLDTVHFPWAEYSKGALTNSLMRTYYLSAEQEAKLPALIKYPANSSEETNAELEYLLTLQQKRTGKEIERAKYIGNIGSWPNIINPEDPDYSINLKELFYIAGDVGSWYNPDNFPATARLLQNCIQDIRVTEFRLKRYFKRPRPYHLEPKLNPIMRISSPSFASGHSLWAFSQAFIFSEIIPEKRNAFLKMAEEVRWSREVLGIHYPSDNEASRIISWHLLDNWYKNPQFAADLENAQLEWKIKSAVYIKKNKTP
jgi:acid phosphatase (class A)